jgi:hypothetical protein
LSRRFAFVTSAIADPGWFRMGDFEEKTEGVRHAS